MTNYIKIAISVLSCLFVISCTNIYRAPLPSNDMVGKGHVLKHHWTKANQTGLSYMSCDYEFYQTAITPSYRKAASDNFVYALMASNAYIALEDVQYDILGWTRTDRWESDRGLGFDVYLKDDKSTPTLVVAFRGTEGQFDDWYHANIAVLRNGQYDEAVEAVETLKNAYPNYKFYVTGHSLGGGLAINTSLRVANVDAIAFNTSPRFEFGKTYNQNEQTIISEKGDGLGIARWIWGIDSSIKTYKINAYEQFNFLNFNWKTKLISEHSMYRLSRGLLITAIAEGNSDALAIFKANFDKDYALATDDKCQKIFGA